MLAGIFKFRTNIKTFFDDFSDNVILTSEESFILELY